MKTSSTFAVFVALVSSGLGLTYSPAHAAELGPIFDCSTHLATVPKNTPCREVKDYGMPFNLGEAQFRLFRFNDSWAEHPEFEVTLKQISESATKATQFFSAFGKVPSVSFYFVNEIGDAAASAAWHQDPCRVSVFFNFTTNPDVARQVIAHEIFHCFQAKNIFLTPDYKDHHSNSWWVEGGADYFSNLVYPSVNAERSDQGKYSILNPLTQQPNDYSVSLFFQFLENRGLATPANLFAWLGTLPHTNNPAGAIAAVSKWPEIGTLFHDFIVAILERKITDTGGGPAGHPSATVDFMPLDLDPASSGPTIGVRPLRGGGAAFRLPRGSDVRLSVSQASWDSGVRVSHRKKGTQSWTPMSPAQPYHAKTACTEFPTEVEFLITTTAPEADQTVELKQEAKAQKCMCTAPKAIIDPCLTGTWEIDRETTSATLTEEFKKGDGEGSGYKVDTIVVTGNSTLTLKSGPSASQHAFDTLDTTTTWKHSETGKKNVLSTIIEANTVVTILQDDSAHICLNYEAADGTITTVMNGSRKQLDAAQFMVGQIKEMKYTCSRQKLELWYAKEQTVLPYMTFKRK